MGIYIEYTVIYKVVLRVKPEEKLIIKNKHLGPNSWGVYLYNNSLSLKLFYPL